ncbi:diaminopimelate dehydrogenase [Gulosibacter sp. 10]|uniref:diaminopimelate dehydrogenase n=1 Tax=Gulosibacter sp. 10 TaxID=1255570 RepID=UPI00097E8CDA|nr:diaminopimelate dehydrogenase [Gulosibacter sp. 10]SJM56567.1 Meso-diaminopimelate D-dehydrogenase [Gulosibacter sp. 10]
MTITTAIVGYGNLGRGVEKLVRAQADMELFGIFSRRNELDTDTPVYPVNDIERYADEIDVLFLCLGSATDIPEQAVAFAERFTTVDTYDNHKQIPAHYRAMDEAARAAGTVAVVATGWDPGLFSLNRVLGAALFPEPQQNTFWGRGLSQGHSNAVRGIEGVRHGVQYTIPSQEAVEAAKAGRGADIDGKRAHLRQCWVVADESEQERIRETIVTMPDYFVGYETEVHFISEEEFLRDHQGLPHGGRVITSGSLGESRSTVEFSLDLESNPDFTAASMVAYGRAAARLAEAGETGARTVLEIPPYLISPVPLEELIRRDV